MKAANNFQIFLLDTNKTYQDPMPFFMQPILGLQDGLVFGFEILFRGGVPPDWSDIDRSVLQHLCDAPADTLPVMFVNICNKAFAEIPHQVFIDASRKNRIYFEIGDSLAQHDAAQADIDKIDALTAHGVLFVLDDFGRSHHETRFAFEHISMLKVDGALMREAMESRPAADRLRKLMQQWREDGMRIIAECVETAEMYAFARELQFDFAQGFHIDAMLNGLDSQDLNSVI